MLKKEKQKTTQIVTVANPKSKVQWVADSNLYGMKFIRTGADHLCTDLNFKAAQLTIHHWERAVMKKDKAACKNSEKIEKESLDILEQEGTDQNKKLTGSELHTLLLFYGGRERKNHGKTVVETRAK